MLTTLMLHLQECRSIYCGGFGHLSTVDSCSDGGIEVLSDEFSICLNFTFVHPTSITTFQKIMSNFTDYLPSWGGLGVVDSVYYKVGGSAVPMAIVTLIIPRNKITYHALINTIKQRLSDKSIVVVEQEKIEIVYSVSEYSRFMISNQKSSFGHYIPYWMDRILSENTNEPTIARNLNDVYHVYEPWLVNNEGFGAPVDFRPRITKLSFCNQVELQQHEIEVFRDIVLYNRINDKFIFENNFVAVRDKETNRLTVRVCLEDFLNGVITSAAGSSSHVFRLSFTSRLATLLMFVFTGTCMQHL